MKRACLNDVGLHYTCFGKSALMHSASCLAWNALECDGIPEWFAMLWLPWLQNSCENAHCLFKGVDVSGECNRMHPTRECRQYSYISGMLGHALDCFWFWVVGSAGRHVRVSQNSVECFGQVMLPLGVAIYKAITPIFGMPRLECQALECQDSGHQSLKRPKNPCWLGPCTLGPPSHVVRPEWATASPPACYFPLLWSSKIGIAHEALEVAGYWRPLFCWCTVLGIGGTALLRHLSNLECLDC